MPAQYILAGDLVVKQPNAECCDCLADPNDAPEEQTWTIWNNSLIYCPKCASYEGIGPND